VTSNQRPEVLAVRAGVLGLLPQERFRFVGDRGVGDMRHGLCHGGHEKMLVSGPPRAHESFWKPWPNACVRSTMSPRRSLRAVLTVTAVPNEPYLQLLLEEPSQALLRSVTSETARRIGQSILVENTSIDWERTPIASQTLDELVEWTLRAVHSFMSNPSDPPRDEDELRGYLRRWLAPAIRNWAVHPASVR
jgi:hypothetical protein